MGEPQENKKKSIKAKFIIGVLSGKGGVGKSTLAGQLAQALNRGGHKVGVFDADVYGPSVRQLLPEDQGPRTEEEKVFPAQSGGISVMSVAYFPRDKGPLVMRAPIAIQIISQFIEEVEWGELDFLLVDFPPGTGDIQITLMQKLSFTGAIVVTTPQELSLLDVRKSMRMCIQMGVPLLGIVENMSYFSEPESLKRHQIFGEGGGKSLSEEFSVPLLSEIPIDPSLNVHKKLQLSSLFDALSKKMIALLEEEKGCKIKVDDRYHLSIEWLDGKKSLYQFADVQALCPCVECLGTPPPL